MRGSPLGPFPASPDALTDTSENIGAWEVGIEAPAEIVNGATAEVPPPGAGFVTVTFAVPAVAISLAKIDAVSCIELTNVVTRGLPFQFTLELVMKPPPVTVSVNAAPTAVAEEGFKFEIVGAGFGGASMKNVMSFEIPPPGAGVTTVISADPGIAMSLAKICATSCPVLGSVVVVRGLPFQSTVEVVSTFSATTFNSNAAPPAIACSGEIVETIGVGLTVGEPPQPNNPQTIVAPSASRMPNRIKRLPPERLPHLTRRRPARKCGPARQSDSTLRQQVGLH